MERGGRGPAASYLYHAAGGCLYLSRAGRDKPRRLERARRGVTHRDPAPLVDYMVVPDVLCLDDPASGVVRIPLPPASARSSIQSAFGGAPWRAHAHSPGTARHVAAGFS